MSEINTENFIKALTIFMKYGNKTYPTHCEHDVMRVNYDPEEISEEDKEQLGELGFFPDEEFDCFKTYGYGSA
jgi:DNA-binding protein YbaB